jgi:hypothetical protein
MKIMLITIALGITTIGVGCAALSEYLTPATVDHYAVEYAAGAGVVEVNDFKGYANLDKAIRLSLAVEQAYDVRVLSLEQMAETNQLDYARLKGVTITNTKVAKQREELLFGPTGLLSTGLTALGFGAFGGLLGLMRKRPGDMTPVEVEQAVSAVTFEKVDRERQMAEVVRGLQSFIDDTKKLSLDELMAGFKDGTIGDVLKSYLSNQSLDTKQTVAMIKAGSTVT